MNTKGEKDKNRRNDTMKDIKFSDEECTNIRDAIDSLDKMHGYMSEDLCRTEKGRVIKFSRDMLNRNIMEIDINIVNLDKIFNKGCEFIPVKEGLGVIFGEGISRAKR